SALCPSTPRAPSFRVRRYASRSHVTSMWCASVVSGMSGADFASFATRSSFVEMVTEPDVPFIVPSFGSMSWHALSSAGSLGSVPPLRGYYGVLRRPALPTSLTRACSAVPSCNGEDRTSQVPRRPLATHAPDYDPGGASEAGLRGYAPTFRLKGVAFRIDQRVGLHACHFGTQL